MCGQRSHNQASLELQHATPTFWITNQRHWVRKALVHSVHYLLAITAVSERFNDFVILVEHWRPTMQQNDRYGIWVLGNLMYKMDVDTIYLGPIMAPAVHFPLGRLPVIFVSPFLYNRFNSPPRWTIRPANILLKLVRIYCIIQFGQLLSLARRETGHFKRCDWHFCAPEPTSQMFLTAFYTVTKFFRFPWCSDNTLLENMQPIH